MTRRLQANRFETICVLVTAAFAGGLAAWLWLKLPWPQCNFRSLFGIPCLTCGSTRAALALLGGDVAAAWRFNPLATLTLCAVVLYNVYALAVLGLRAPPLRVCFGWRVVLPVLAAAGLLNWLYLLRHG